MGSESWNRDCISVLKSWPEMTNVSKHGEIGIDSTTDPAEGLQNWTHEELEDGHTRQMN